MSWRQARVWAVVLGVAGIVAFALYRFARTQGPSGEDLWLQPVREGEAAFADMAMISIADLREEGSIERVIAQGEWHADPSISAACLAALEREIATFLRLQFVTADAAAYRQWREARGCALLSLDDMERKTQVVSEYASVMNKRPPPEPDVASLYDEYWLAMRTAFSGSGALLEISADPRGFATRVAYSSDPLYTKVMLDAGLGDRLWYGPIAASMRAWFAPARIPADLVERDGRVLMAEVGVVAAWADGGRRPLLLTWFFDPTLDAWVLWTLNQNNFDPQRVAPAPIGY